MLCDGKAGLFTDECRSYLYFLVVKSWGDVSQSWSDVSHPLLLLTLSCYIGPNLPSFVVSKYTSIVDSQSIIVV